MNSLPVLYGRLFHIRDPDKDNRVKSLIPDLLFNTGGFMSKTLYVSDLDGTLLNSESRVSEYTGRMLNRMISEGLTFTYATARSFSTAQKVCETIKVPIPVIVYNGCAIVENGTGRLISNEKFSTEESEYIMWKLLNNGLSPLVYAYIDGIEKVSFDEHDVNYGMRVYLESRAGDKRLNPVLKDQVYSGEIFYYTIIGENARLKPLFNEFSKDQRYNATLQQDMGNAWWLEIMPKKATKAAAICKLKKILGCDRIVSFGDSINDIPMFEIFDECYSVENSVEKLKVMSTEVIGKNTDDAVIQKIMEKFY